MTGDYMIERIKGLNKGGKIRLCVFMALLLWCIYLGAGYSYSLEGQDQAIWNIFPEMSYQA